MHVSGPNGANPYLNVLSPQPAPKPQAAAKPDAALWNVLTDEEKGFFEQLASMGPLTYGGRGAQQQPAEAPLGQRIDVRG